MICREVGIRLSDYLDGELDGPTRTRVDRHLEECPACAAELRELRGAVDLLRGLPEPEPPADLVEGVMQQVRGSPRRREGWRRLLDARVGGAAAAAAAVIVAVGAFDRTDTPGSVQAPGARAPSGAELARPAPRVAAGQPAYFRGLEPPADVGDLDRDLELAESRPDAFAIRMRELPAGDRERLLASLAERAAESGKAEAIGRRLLESDDSFARSLANSFRGAAQSTPRGQPQADLEGGPVRVP